MIALIIFCLLVALGATAYNQHYEEKARADKAKRMQTRILEARKGYKKLRPSRPTDRPY
jgi:hypothetical protein